MTPAVKYSEAIENKKFTFCPFDLFLHTALPIISSVRLTVPLRGEASVALPTEKHH